jgi:hypothetical protein
VRINRPGGNVDTTIGTAFSVANFSGFNSCGPVGGVAGCTVLSCPPAGIGSCSAGTSGRPSCSAALNGSGSARFVVGCSQ